GYVFSGWTGACNGLGSTCTVITNGHVQANATFTAVTSDGGGGGGAGGGGGGGGTTTGSTASLSVKTSGGKGLITSTPAGISCGTTCSAKAAPGTAITLSILPEPGFRFVNWTGACTGTVTSCPFALNATASVQ